MQLSENELTMLKIMRRQKESHALSRRLTILVAGMLLLASGLCLWLSVREANLIIFLIAMIYVMFSVVTWNAVFVFWHGNPQNVLLLKVIDELIEQSDSSRDDDFADPTKRV